MVTSHLDQNRRCLIYAGKKKKGEDRETLSLRTAFEADVADDDDEPPEVTPRVVIPVAIAEAPAAAQPQIKPRGTDML